ncbi:MAG: FAD-binding protein, partial [Ilumatobacteraceae bacterium]|nr:FAD-binding protein [Ilumatobacteraceae bacterium]
TAWSGGQVWIPNNPHMRDVGVDDSRERAITYIMSLSRGMLEERLVEAYVDAGPEMIELLEAKTPVQFYAVPGMPDYHPEFPGGSPGGGRTLECPIFPFAELGEWAARVTPSPYFADPRITMSETPLGKAVPEPPSPEELARRSERDERGCGQALAGRLLKACLDRGIAPRTGCAGRELIVRDGAVVGIVVDTPDGPIEVETARGVILASGGFEWDPELVRTFLRGPMTHPVSMPTSTGDALRMSMRVGAALSNMREAWWIPVGVVPEGGNAMGRNLVNGQRTLPHSIMVNRRGRRFTNEAANYNAFGAAFHVEDVSRFEYANLPCWLVFDQTYVDRYGFRVSAGGGAGDVPAWIPRGDTPAQLAEQLGIDADELARTIERWNEHCEAGHDPDFGRGDSAFDCWWGDPYRKGRRDATLGPLTTGPYYAFEIHSGCLGTKGGPRVDPDARVLDLDGAPIPGLYAAGNAMGSPFGMTYGGPGGTLGPAMVFGYLAGRHAAGRR